MTTLTKPKGQKGVEAEKRLVNTSRRREKNEEGGLSFYRQSWIGFVTAFG